MYCKTCGTANADHNNYCTHDGSVLLKKQPGLQLVKKDSIYCSGCGSKAASQDNYCLSCGNALFTYQKTSSELLDKSVLFPASAEKDQSQSWKWPNLNISYLKQALVPTAIAFILMLVINFFVFESTQKYYTDLSNEMPAELDLQELIHSIENETDTELPKLDSLYGFTDMVMASHLNSPTIKLNLKGRVDGEEGHMEGKAGLTLSFLVYLLIPVLSLFISGILYGRNHKEVQIEEKVYTAIGIGLLYGAVLSIFSLFSGFSYDVNIHEEFTKISLDVGTSYSLLQAVLAGFILGTVFSFIGILFSIDYRRFTGHLTQAGAFGQAVHQGFSTFVRGFVIMAGTTILIFISKFNTMKEDLELFVGMGPEVFEKLLEKTTAFAVLIGTQIGSFILGLVHFSPLTFNFDIESEGESGGISYSLLSGFTSEGDTELEDALFLWDLFGNSSDLSLFLKFAVLVPILLFIWSGYQIAKSGASSFTSLGAYSFTYALFLALLTSISSFSFEFSYRGTDMGLEKNSLFLGVGTIGIFIRSFLFSYLFSYIGTYISRWRN